ncbi:HesA/moeB/thiF family protein [Cavenderia fasciculata]|uniref:HesA/moeB/thiF family protein n=1 Tax=Cavenderia fasciculata TaxID=261658 RepID=F4PTF1_CACFS|nr:HesA/moeB/thiF family protein [Cavenderia fasciculata]EGG21673.1 HesA/moeB/thiF family protein [Cavenderia fasciculata]|eukprot:XP_004359523.1 HesA/moeB/thiF family protein [Cavenderia fasciculata]
MDNRFIIAALGAGIGAAATYITSKVSNTPVKKRKKTSDGDEGISEEEVNKMHLDSDDIQPIDTTNMWTQPSAAPSSSSSVSTADPFAKDKTNIDTMQQEQIFDEQMNRTMLYYGEENFKKIRGAFIIVVGLGGVGGAAAHVLLRSGVKKIRLIDPDLVTISSLNRNVLAQRKDVGRSKVEMMKSYFAAICPEVEVEAFQTFFTGDLAPQLLGGKPDYVLDCIDNTETKVQLLTYCHQNGLPVMSSFGAGSSSDPTKINICDLAFTFGCPFGKEVRRLLRVNGITSGIPCVYSTETHRKKLIPLTEEEKELLKTQVKSTLRVRTLGVSMPIPTIFGSTMGNACLNALVGLPLVLEEEKRAPPAMGEYNKMLKVITKMEQVVFHTSPLLVRKMIDSTTLRYLVDEVYGGCSGVSGENKQTLTTRRWRPELPLAPSNIVVLTCKEAEAHERQTSPVQERYSAEVVAKIDQILSQVADVSPSAGSINNLDQASMKETNKKIDQANQQRGQERRKNSRTDNLVKKGTEKDSIEENGNNNNNNETIIETTSTSSNSNTQEEN